MNATSTVNATNAVNSPITFHTLIEPNTLLQVDGTVIAGILILLTLSAFTGKGITPLRIPLDWNPRSVVAITIIPFSISGAALVWGSLTDTSGATPIAFVISYFCNLLIAPSASFFGFAYMAWIAVCIWMAKEDTTKERNFIEKLIDLVAKILRPMVKYDKKRDRKKNKDRDIKKLQKIFEK